MSDPNPKSTRSSFEFIIGLIILLALLALMCAIYYGGYSDGKKDMQVEAVEKKYAHWKTDTKGNSTFEWGNLNE